MNPMYGTSLYCGIDIELAQIKEHLEMAASVGIKLPEAQTKNRCRDGK